MRLPWLRVAVRGPSMIPALAPGEQVLARRAVRIRTGAVVVVRRPHGYDVKRIARVSGDEVWVEGDNREVSTDSRTYGAVRTSDVVAEVRWRYWPPRHAGRVR